MKNLFAPSASSLISYVTFLLLYITSYSFLPVSINEESLFLFKANATPMPSERPGSSNSSGFLSEYILSLLDYFHWQKLMFLSLSFFFKKAIISFDPFFLSPAGYSSNRYLLFARTLQKSWKRFSIFYS